MKSRLSLFVFMAVILVATLSLPACAVATSTSTTEATPPAEWTTFIKNLQREMLAKGISQKTIDEAYKGKNYYHKGTT